MIKLTTEELRLGLDSILYALPDRIANILKKLPLCVKSGVYELRLRVNKPISLTMEQNFFVSLEGSVSTRLPQNPLIISSKELNEVITRICERSVYAKTEELKNGYISMKNGNRAGVCGSFKDGIFSDISSINIRIARTVKGAAKSLYNMAVKGLFIVGGPGSGKTTLLRDLVRHLSNSGKRVCVVDSRGEIAALYKGVPTLDVGINTDVLSGICKEKGLEIAIRTMFPEIVAFDEIANKVELERLFEGFFAGVKIIATIHAGDKEELKKRVLASKLIKCGVFENIAFLSGKIGGEIEIISAKDFAYA